MEPTYTRDSHPNLFLLLQPWRKNVLLNCFSYCSPSDITCNILIGTTDTDICCFPLLPLLNRKKQAGIDGTHLVIRLKHIQTKPFPHTPKQESKTCNHKKVFFKYIDNKQKQKENTGPLLNRKGELVTSDAERIEVLKTFFTSVFIHTFGPGLGNKIPG